MHPAKGKFESGRDQARMSILGELASFMGQNKKWWLLPILIILAMIAMLTFIAGTGAGPFVYTLF